MLNLADTPPLVATSEADSQRVDRRRPSLADRADRDQYAPDRRSHGSRTQHGDPEGSADVFVLDDVTPRYATASAALNACRAGLGHALQYLSESGNPA